MLPSISILYKHIYIYRQVALSIKGCLFMNAGWDYQGIPLQWRAQKSTTDAIESDKNTSKHRIQMSRDGIVGACAPLLIQEEISVEEREQSKRVLQQQKNKKLSIPAPR